MNENYLELLKRTKEQLQYKGEDRYKKFKLSFNPFPKSGTANINESDEFTKNLEPVDTDTLTKVVQYVIDSLYAPDENDQKLIATILGDYGTGKTQLLLFVKYLLQKESPTKSFVVYINNPGTKLSELIGAIIDEIGREHFKKFIWNHVINEISLTKNNYKELLLKFISGNTGLFGPDKSPFSDEAKSNHKTFLDTFLNNINNRNKRKEFNIKIKDIILEILRNKFDDDVIADYFYNIISEDIGVSKTWETMTSGSGKYLDKKVVFLLNAIIELIRDQGFERFYLLVDEFEDITSGRLTKKEIDNYSHNLRTLIDKQRRWCLLIAMTEQALRELRKSSPPLVDRLTDREIRLEKLHPSSAQKLIKNYLRLAKLTNDDSIAPFSDDVIEYLCQKSNNFPRLLLRNCFFLIERGIQDANISIIDKKFAENHLDN